VRCVTPIADKRDLTKWVVAASVDIAESSEMQSIYTMNASQKLGFGGSTAKSIAWGTFYGSVSDGAKYDVKDKIKVQFGEDPIKIGNNWYEYSTAGNILYGFYGKAAGFSDDELFVGAGAAQIYDNKINKEGDLGPVDAPFYGDTTDDHYAIEFGIYLYNNYYVGDGILTISDLQNALDTFVHANELALGEAPKIFLPRYNEYRADRFYQQ
jgi:hypothetical protein